MKRVLPGNFRKVFQSVSNSVRYQCLDCGAVVTRTHAYDRHICDPEVLRQRGDGTLSAEPNLQQGLSHISGPYYVQLPDRAAASQGTGACVPDVDAACYETAADVDFPGVDALAHGGQDDTSHSQQADQHAASDVEASSGGEWQNSDGVRLFAGHGAEVQEPVVEQQQQQPQDQEAGNAAAEAWVDAVHGGGAAGLHAGVPGYVDEQLQEMQWLEQQVEDTWAEHADYYAATDVDMQTLLDEREEQAARSAEQRAATRAEQLSWLDVAHEPVSRVLDAMQHAEADKEGRNHRPFTVLTAAACIVHTMTSTSCTFETAKSMIDTTAFGLLPGAPSPENVDNRFPPSMYVCYQILQVPSLSEYEVHLCPEGCLFKFDPVPDNIDLSAHVRSCGGCKHCRCPCGARRFHMERGKVIPTAMCYFLHDFVEQFFWSEEWYSRVSRSRAQRLSPWYRSHEGKNRMQRLQELGYPMDLVRGG